MENNKKHDNEEKVKNHEVNKDTNYSENDNLNFYKEDIGASEHQNENSNFESIQASHYVDNPEEYERDFNVYDPDIKELEENLAAVNIANSTNSYDNFFGRNSDASLTDSSDRDFSSDSNASKNEIEDSEITNADIQEEIIKTNKFIEFVHDFVCNKKFFFSLIAIAFGIASCFTENIYVNISTAESKSYKIAINKFFMATCAFLSLTVVLGWFIERVTFKILKNTVSNTNSVVFYINGCSFHISLTISILSLMIFIWLTIGDFVAGNFTGFELHSKIVLPLTIAFVLLFALQKCTTQNTTFSFNYSTYLKRIKRTLFMDLFITIMNNFNDFKRDETDDYVYEGPLDKFVDNSNIFVPVRSRAKKSKKLSTYIFDSRFTISRNLMTFGTKFILLNEFKSMCRGYKYNNEPILSVLNKIKEKAKGKSNFLYKKLVRHNKIKNIKDFKFIFKNPSVFTVFLEQTGLKKSDEVTKDFLEFFLEKCYKEKYMISYSLKQLHNAIDRVSFAVQILIFSIYILSIFLTGKTDKDSTGALISAILGIPIIASLIRENLIQPIMFLFVTHPYDVGDRVLITLGGKLENLVVSELNVFSTHFYRWDGTCFFVPNSILSQTAICNIRRSGPLMEYHHIQISSKTDARKLYDLKRNLQKYVKKYPNYYTDYILVNYEKVVDSNKLYIKVLMQYKTNIQNYEHYLGLKSNFICYLNKQISQLGIVYTLPTQTISIDAKA